MRGILPVLAAVGSVFVVERLHEWWYLRVRPLRAPGDLTGEVPFRMGRMPGVSALFFASLLLWIAGSQLLHDRSAPSLASGAAWLGCGALLLRAGVRWLHQRLILTVGPTGIRLPDWSHVEWTDLEGIVITGRNVVLISQAARDRSSTVRSAVRRFSSDVRGFPVWAMPQTQALGTRAFAALLHHMEEHGIAALPLQGPDGLGFWGAIRRRI